MPCPTFQTVVACDSGGGGGGGVAGAGRGGRGGLGRRVQRAFWPGVAREISMGHVRPALASVADRAVTNDGPRNHVVQQSSGGRPGRAGIDAAGRVSRGQGRGHGQP